MLKGTSKPGLDWDEGERVVVLDSVFASKVAIMKRRDARTAYYPSLFLEAEFLQND